MDSSWGAGLQKHAILLAIDGICVSIFNVFPLQIVRAVIFFCMPYSARKFAPFFLSHRRLPPGFHRIFLRFYHLLTWVDGFGPILGHKTQHPWMHMQVRTRRPMGGPQAYPGAPIRKGICAPGGPTWGVECRHFCADRETACDSCASTIPELWTFF